MTKGVPFEWVGPTLETLVMPRSALSTDGECAFLPYSVPGVAVGILTAGNEFLFWSAGTKQAGTNARISAEDVFRCDAFLGPMLVLAIHFGIPQEAIISHLAWLDSRHNLGSRPTAHDYIPALALSTSVERLVTRLSSSGEQSAAYPPRSVLFRALLIDFIERCTRTQMEEFLDFHLFGPLCMSKTGCCSPSESHERPISGHLLDGSAIVPSFSIQPDRIGDTLGNKVAARVFHTSSARHDSETMVGCDPATRSEQLLGGARSGLWTTAADSSRFLQAFRNLWLEGQASTREVKKSVSHPNAFHTPPGCLGWRPDKTTTTKLLWEAHDQFGLSILGIVGDDLTSTTTGLNGALILINRQDALDDCLHLLNRLTQEEHVDIACSALPEAYLKKGGHLWQPRAEDFLGNLGRADSPIQYVGSYALEKKRPDASDFLGDIVVTVCKGDLWIFPAKMEMDIGESCFQSPIGLMNFRPGECSDDAYLDFGLAWTYRRIKAP